MNKIESVWDKIPSFPNVKINSGSAANLLQTPRVNLEMEKINICNIFLEINNARNCISMGDFNFLNIN